MNLAEFLTPLGLAVLIVFTMRDAQKDRAAENLRRDAREDNVERQRAEDNKQWLMMFTALTGKQVEIKSTVEHGERTVTENVLTARDEVIQGLEDLKGLFIMTFDMMMEDPRATRERIKRMQKAWAQGDKVTAQAVVDEAPLEIKREGSTP